jgi:sugar lactone lactonase YvrE
MPLLRALLLAAAAHSARALSASPLPNAPRRLQASASPSPCPLGVACADGTPVLCAAGTYGAFPGVCAPCAAPPGFACAPGATNSSGVRCVPGSFCLGGSAPALPCTLPAACAAPGAAVDALAGLQWTSSTLAGSGASGYAEGLGTAAVFMQPWGLTVEYATGVVYVADTQLFIIRRISPAGATSLLAGVPGTQGFADGPALSSTFTTPGSLAHDPALQRLYAVDSPPGRLRYVALGSATVVTLAGGLVAGNVDGVGAAAAFATQLTGVACCAPGGVVLVTSFGASSIRAVTPAGAVTSLAGSGAAGNVNGFGAAAAWGSSWGIALVPGDGSAAWFGDQTNHLLRAIAPATGVVSTFAGSGTAGTADGARTRAQLTGPTGVAAFASGALAVVEYSGASRLRLVSRWSGAVLTAAGAASGAAGFAEGLGSDILLSAPVGVGVDASGAVHLADSGSRRVRKLTPSLCPAGSWCLKGKPFLCAPGTFGGAVGLSAPGCSGPCAAAPGWGCGWGALTPAGTLCAPGFFCPGGAAPPTPCTCPSACAAPGLGEEVAARWRVATVAGNGTGGFADGPGSAARFLSPRSPVLFGSMLYVGDDGGARVRTVDTSTPAFTVGTLAGTGLPGFLNGPGSAAQFNRPLGLCLAPSGEALYVTDLGNNRVRGIAPLAPPGAAAVVSTLAGSGAVGGANGVGTAATFSSPNGCAVDPSGALLFVAELGGHRIRQVVLATATTTTIAGSGVAGGGDGVGLAATFSNPVTVAVGRPLAGGPGLVLYIGDRVNNRVRSIATSPSGVPATVTTLVGTGTPGGGEGVGTAAPIAFPDGLALWNNTLLFVCAEGTSTPVTGVWRALRTLNLATLATATLVGAVSMAGQTTRSDGVGVDARFLVPGTLALAPSGSEAYIADSGAQVLLRATCAPCPRGFYCPPSGGAVLPCAPGTFGGGVGLSAPTCSGPCTASPGWGCGWNSTTPAGSPCPPYTFCVGGAAPPAPCACPAACAGGGAAADPTATTTTTTTTTTCAMVCAARAVAGTGVPGASADGAALGGAAIAKPRSLAIRPDGATLWLTEDNDGTARALVRQVTPGGVISRIAGAGGGYAEGVGAAAQFNRPLSITMDPTGGMAYIADYSNQRVRSVSPVGTVGTLAGSGTAGAADGMGASAQFNGPHYVCYHAGTVYVSDALNARLRAIAVASGAVSTLAGGAGGAGFANGPLLSALFSTPKGLALSPDGATLYLADHGNRCIRALSLATRTAHTLSGTCGAPAARVDGAGTAALWTAPESLLVDATGFLWVTESTVGAAPALRTVHPGTGFTATVATLRVSAGWGVNASGLPLLNPTGLVLLSGSAGGGGSTTSSSAATGVLADNLANQLYALDCGLCPVGFFCPSGTGTALPCPAGSFGNASGLSAPTCSGPCTAAPGFACPGGSTTPAGMPCPPGHACPGGAAPPVLAALSCAASTLAGIPGGGGGGL